ncbi:MAG: MerR family transcriptional regulator [Thermodesulfovibrionales bacterium]|nr:MerR family transcriptional regulator [Thermodesulfovibrionales bacterium]
MTPINEDNPQGFTLSREKLFYKIGEVSKIVGLQTHIIRYWESVFPLIKPKKSKSGQRVYTQKEIDLLLYIKKLQKEEGYKIEGIKKKINEKVSDTKASDTHKEITEIKGKELVSFVKDRLNKILSQMS